LEPGRPRRFDESQALDAALAVFWRNGYQGTSLADLTQAMGINKPSLYAAFGNKEQLYLRALHRYRDQQIARHAAALAAAPELRSALRAFLRSVATMLTEPALPGGCMVVTSAVACGTAGLPQDVAEALESLVNRSLLDLLQNRLDADREHLTSPESVDTKVLADYFATVMSGMAIMAKLGAERKRLFAVIEPTLRALD